MAAFLHAFILLLIFLPSNLSFAAVINVHFDEPGKPISPTLWGVTLEDLNHSGDGGLYGELIINRGLSPAWPQENNNSPYFIPLFGYSTILSDNVTAGISLSTDHPLNPILNSSIHLQVSSDVPAGKRVGVANDGFSGIPIRPDYTTYHASFYAKVLNSSFQGPLTVSIESLNGTVTYAIAQVTTKLTNTFQKFQVALTPNPNLIQIPCYDNLFTISAHGPVPNGTSIYFQMISLFPPTFKNRTNGMRIDLAEKIAGLKPSFLRLPGGTFLRGNSLAQHFNWSNSIGDLTLRPGHMRKCSWYSCPNQQDRYTTDGMGLLEMFQFTEDLNVSTVVLAVFAGYSNETDFVSASEIGPYVDSALNEIEYLIGDPITSFWGRKRAEHGHPEPFKSLKYIEIGTYAEDNSLDSKPYWDRYKVFEQAIREKYPELEIISTARYKVTSDMTDIALWEKYTYYDRLTEDHSYFDNFSARSNVSKIVVNHFSWIDGEWMVADLTGAIVDAAMMLSMERNSNLVIMATHAHLATIRYPNCSYYGIMNTPTLLEFNSVLSYYTPPGWTQHLFGNTKGDTLIESETAGVMVFAGANRDTQNGILNVRIVNANLIPTLVQINLRGLEQGTEGGIKVVLTGTWFNGEGENDLEHPLRVAPREELFPERGSSFSIAVPATSLTILKLKLKQV